jgi:hypothetical protein
MSKDKKKKKKNGAGKTAKRLKALADNRIVADVVAAALVGAAAALKDSRAARKLAETAGDELEKLSKKSAERGNAMWQLALDVGRRALDEVIGESAAPKAPKAPKSPKAPKAPARPRKAARKTAARRSGAKPAR